MHGIDMHCDTLMKGIIAMATGKADSYDLYSIPDTMVDFKKLVEGEAMAQCFAVFLLPGGAEKRLGVPMSDMDYIQKGVDIFNASVAAHSDIVAPATNANEIRRNFLNGKVSAVLTMEDGRAVDGKLENIKKFYDDGFRALSIIWNNENCFAFPNAWDEETMMKGLKPFGKEAVQYMQELGMLVDVSHLNFGGFYDVAEVCKKPFVATHSNAWELCHHKRNLKDDMLKIMGDKGCVTGLNFGPEFINEDTQTAEKNEFDPNSRAFRIAEHARHIANVGGIDTVALGTDFDGIHGNFEVPGPDKMFYLEAAFKNIGFTEAEIDKIAYRNALRVFDEAMK